MGKLLEECRESMQIFGFDTIEESINNDLIHAISFLEYKDIPKFEKDLIEEAKEIGIKFCPKCNLAMINNECYLCNKMKNLKR